MPAGFESSPTPSESLGSLKERLKLMEGQVYDAERTGDVDWANELKIEIEEVKSQINKLVSKESEKSMAAESTTEKTSPKTEKDMVMAVKEMMKNGTPKSIAINEVLIGTNDKARRVYLRNLIERKTK